MRIHSGLAILHNGHRTRLKWHQLRVGAANPVFDLGVMRKGFDAGASLELDLRVRGDGGFVVLHDDVLENETNSKGRVADMRREDLDGVCYTQSGAPVITSEILAAQLGAAHPDTVLQFDMKDDLQAVGETGLKHIGQIVGAHAERIIISGDDLALFTAARRVIPDVPRGIDPTNDIIDAATRGGWPAACAALEDALAAPTGAGTVYLHWQLVLKASEAGHDLIGTCQSQGKLVDAWTFNLKAPDQGFSDAEWSDFKRLVDLGPDQITTDEAPATERAWHLRMDA